MKCSSVPGKWKVLRDVVYLYLNLLPVAFTFSWNGKLFQVIDNVIFVIKA